MKKLLFTFAFAACIFAANLVSAGNYKVEDATIDQLFSSADDVTFAANDLSLMSPSTATLAAGGQTVSGYLLRSFFCGFIALHRSYMGTSGKTLWYYYFCIPVVGGVVGCVDFWWVVFKGSEAMNKYTDNPKFIVWSGE